MIYASIETQKRHFRMKQDVYEHLAKTFLDKKKKQRPGKKIWIAAAAIVVALFLLLSITVALLTHKKLFSRSLYVLNSNVPTVIEYDFTSLGGSKTKAISFNLNNIDLSRYKFLDLSIRMQENSRVSSTVKVQIENSLLEKDTQYIPGINVRWQKISLPLANFKLIKDWSGVKSLAFIIEDWNVSIKKDSVIIDDIHFME